MNSLWHIIDESRRLMDQVETIGLIHDREIRGLQLAGASEPRLERGIDQIRRHHDESLRRLMAQFKLNDQRLPERCEGTTDECNGDIQ